MLNLRTLIFQGDYVKFYLIDAVENIKSFLLISYFRYLFTKSNGAYLFIRNLTVFSIVVSVVHCMIKRDVVFTAASQVGAMICIIWFVGASLRLSSQPSLCKQAERLCQSFQGSYLLMLLGFTELCTVRGLPVNYLPSLYPVL